MNKIIYHSERRPTAQSPYTKGGVSCSKDSFVVAESSVHRIKFSAENACLPVAEKR
jgi:hypothetical protein